MATRCLGAGGEELLEPAEEGDGGASGGHSRLPENLDRVIESSEARGRGDGCKLEGVSESVWVSD